MFNRQKIHNLASNFLARLLSLALNLASLALKWSFSRKIWNILQESCKKNLEDNFLVRFYQILQENYFTIFLAIFLQDFSFLARKAFSATSCKSCKKNTCKIWIFLARRFLLGCTAVHNNVHISFSKVFLSIQRWYVWQEEFYVR